MKKSKILIFIIFVWLLATVPYLLTRGLLSLPLKGSLILGSTSTIFVVGFLFLWMRLRKKFKVPSCGLALAIIYLLLATGLLVMGILGQAKEPLIWEAVGPLIIMLCPITTIIFSIPIPSFFMLEFILAICTGGIFYYFLGSKIFEKFILKNNII